MNTTTLFFIYEVNDSSTLKSEFLDKWRNIKHCFLFLICHTSTTPSFDEINPKIQWLNKLPSSLPTHHVVRLPSLQFIPFFTSSTFSLPNSFFVIRTTIGHYEGFLSSGFHSDHDIPSLPILPEVSIVYENPNWVQLWEETINIDYLAYSDLRMRICFEVGEWEEMEKHLFQSNGRKSLSRFHFFQAVIQWGKSRRNPNRDKVLLSKLLLMEEHPEIILWLVRIFSRHLDWNRTILFYHVFQEIKENEYRQRKDDWVELPTDSFYKQIWELSSTENRCRDSFWKNMIHKITDQCFLEKLFQEWEPLCLRNMSNVEHGDLWKGQLSKDFVSSSCGLVSYPTNPDFYVVNVRTVNYRIQPDGSYKTFLKDKECNPFQCKTENYAYLMDKETLTPVLEDWIRMETTRIFLRQKEFRIQGIEDIRLLQKNKEIWFYGTTKEFSYNECIRVLIGKYNLESKCLTDTICLHPPLETLCEKNWTFCNETFSLVLYQWNPIQIFRIDSLGKCTDLVFSIPTPSLFKEIRGSSPFVRWKDMIWTVVHRVVLKRQRRHYLHFVVCLSTSDYSILGFSPPFVFEKNQPIQYCIGFDIYKEKFLFLYSTNDCTSRFIRCSVFDLFSRFNWFKHVFF